jgi:hypothetical protein
VARDREAVDAQLSLVSTLAFDPAGHDGAAGSFLWLTTDARLQRRRRGRRQRTLPPEDNLLA